jgi:hypothetical protein
MTVHHALSFRRKSIWICRVHGIKNSLIREREMFLKRME